MQVSYKIFKESFEFAQSNLLSRRVVLRQLWIQGGLRCLGVKAINIVL
jgi:hypothetical protein